MSDTACQPDADLLQAIPDKAALVRFADHCTTCRTCCARDDEGAKLDLPCADQDRLHEEYRHFTGRSR
ncbi:hypothetical protein GCM10023097_54820 [Streptomyces collinus]